MLVLNAYFYRELRFVTILRSKLRFYSEIQELTQILLRVSEEKIGGWGLWSQELISTLMVYNSFATTGVAVRGTPLVTAW